MRASQSHHVLGGAPRSVDRAERATGNHTTLLLNCTKQKQCKKLKSFVRDESKDIDVEAAIAVLRSAGYYDDALFLAKRNGEHDWYLKIVLESVGAHEDALAYIRGLSFLLAERYLKAYGKVLMNVLPEETTEALKQLCTTGEWSGGGDDAGGEEEEDDDGAAAAAAAASSGRPKSLFTYSSITPSSCATFSNAWWMRRRKPTRRRKITRELRRSCGTPSSSSPSRSSTPPR